MSTAVAALSVRVRALSARVRALGREGAAGVGELGADGLGTVPALGLLCGCLGGIGIPAPLKLDGLGAFEGFVDCGYGESEDSRLRVDCVERESGVDGDRTDADGVDPVWVE